jgi:hypothetical protein
METHIKETHTRIRVEDLKTLKEIQSATNVPSLTEVLHSLLNNKEPSALTLVNLLDQDLEYLKKIQKEVGSDLGHVVHQIVKSQSSIEIVTPSKVLNERYPICLVGKSGVGKSHWLKNTFLKNSYNTSTKDNPVLNYPVLVIDSNNEYDLKEIKSIREIDLSSTQKVKFCPLQHSLMCVMQVRQLFTEMNSLIDMDKEALSKLILVIEEANLYKSNWFNGFLYRSRHLVRKMIVVTPQTDCFQGLQTFTVFR